MDVFSAVVCGMQLAGIIFTTVKMIDKCARTMENAPAAVQDLQLQFTSFANSVQILEIRCKQCLQHVRTGTKSVIIKSKAVKFKEAQRCLMRMEWFLDELKALKEGTRGPWLKNWLAKWKWFVQRTSIQHLKFDLEISILELVVFQSYIDYQEAEARMLSTNDQNERHEFSIRWKLAVESLKLRLPILIQKQRALQEVERQKHIDVPKSHLMSSHMRENEIAHLRQMKKQISTVARTMKREEREHPFATVATRLPGATSARTTGVQRHYRHSRPSTNVHTPATDPGNPSPSMANSTRLLSEHNWPRYDAGTHDNPPASQQAYRMETGENSSPSVSVRSDSSEVARTLSHASPLSSSDVDISTRKIEDRESRIYRLRARQSPGIDRNEMVPERNYQDGFNLQSVPGTPAHSCTGLSDNDRSTDDKMASTSPRSGDRASRMSQYQTLNDSTTSEASSKSSRSRQYRAREQPISPAIQHLEHRRAQKSPDDGTVHGDPQKDDMLRRRKRNNLRGDFGRE